VNELFQAAAKISSMWSLAAFAIAAVIFFAIRGGRGKVNPIAWGVVVAIIVLGLVPIVGSLYVQARQDEGSAIYRVRVVVVGADGVPSNEARVWSSIGGEAKKVDGGWQFDIPAKTKPADGKLTVYAEMSSAFEKGQKDVILAADFSPSITVPLAQDSSAVVRGQVLDASGRAIAGARVNVSGFGQESVTTQTDGGFVLPAHAAKGQQVQLHAEKGGYAAVNQGHPAGTTAVTIVLDPDKPRR
jgi:hypothetical protein